MIRSLLELECSEVLEIFLKLNRETGGRGPLRNRFIVLQVRVNVLPWETTCEGRKLVYRQEIPDHRVVIKSCQMEENRVVRYW